MGFPGSSVVKNPPANASNTGSILRKVPWRRKWQPVSVFLPEIPWKTMDRGTWYHKRVGQNNLVTKQQ